ncbi:polysaccharide biosynthesis tyrosine autokinase [Enterobacter hormaechei]|nr:polysaccharide biosynthesis tyrosine autokinase [Enterobacter hormaechei]
MSSYTTDNYGAAAPQQHEVDLVRLLVEMIDHRTMILCVTFLFTLCAGLYAWVTPPVYQADAMVQIESKQDNSLLKGLSQLGTDVSPDVAPEILLLKSRMILGETVDKLGLTQQAKQRVLPVVGRLWQRLQGRGQGKITLGELQIPQVEGKAQELTLTVQEAGKYHLTGENIEADGRVGKTLVTQGIVLLVTSIEATPGTQFSLKSLTRLERINALKKSLTVAESEKQSGIVTLTLTGEDPDNIARVLNAYRAQRDSVDLSLEAKSVLDQVVNVENQLNELTFREAEISQLFKKSHPTYRALHEKRQTLERERDRLNNRVSAMPSTQQEILRLSRDVESGRTIYLQLLTRQQELNISRSSAVGNVRIIDEAVTHPDPIKPRKALIIILGALFGLMLAMGTVLVRQAFKRGITLSEQLEAQGLPVLATLPRSQWLWSKTHLRRKNPFSRRWKHKTSDVPFLPVDRPADMFVEAVRGLRTSLYFAMMEAENRIVMISGPTQDCGKTLVATNLAAVAGQSGQRVLFIDADMRQGYVHNIFGLENRYGLSCLLEGKCDCTEVIQHAEKAGIDVITCGPEPLRPLELLLSERFLDIMSWVNEQYDIVIIDTPPVLAVTDASLVARAAGTTLMVARFDKTSVKEMENTVKRLQHVGVKVSGTILNDIVKSAALFYSSGYSQCDYGYASRKKGDRR